MAAKDSTNSTSLGWGVAGNTLVYQSPSRIDGGEEDRSKLVLHCLARSRDEILVDLAEYDPLFDQLDVNEDNKWKIWIPQSTDRGDKFLTGQKIVPKYMLVTSHPRTTVELQSNPRGVSQKIRDFLARRTPNLPTTIHQALAIISLDPETLGQVICNWTIDDEIRCFDANSHYFAYSKRGSRHKYNLCFFNKIIPTWPEVYKAADQDAISKALSTFAFPASKEICALGSDVAGQHIFVCFTASAQIINVKNGASLKKTDLAMPPLKDTVPPASLKTRFTFLQPTESIIDGQKHLIVDLCCHLLYDEVYNDLVQHRQATALWKLHAILNPDETVDTLGWRPAFMSTPKMPKQHIPTSVDNMTLSSSRLHECLAISSVRVNAEQMKPRNRGSHAYHQQRGIPLVGSIPYIVTHLYDVSIFEDDVDESSGAQSAKSAKWLHPTSSIHILSPSNSKGNDSSLRPKSRRSSSAIMKPSVPIPTVDSAPIVVGCGWVVFAKDRSDQCNALNLYGRIGNAKKADELIIVRFD
ncbi:hypothetical protein ABW19_dt0209253 [Dactylella cylindrospora]|nr:hypothetical protein ABW19_dt0209253 [Dactylella cylindrospora]